MTNKMSDETNKVSFKCGHTPGPWQLNKDGARNMVTIGPGIVCWIESYKPQATANAHLISAAPELLEALEDLLAMDRAVISRIGDKELAEFDATWQIKKVRAAINKAKGASVASSVAPSTEGRA